MSEHQMLAEHGTKLLSLKPINVVQAAEADLTRYMRNTEPIGILQWEGALHWRNDAPEPYAFHRSHVRKTMGNGGTSTAAQLIALAVTDPAPGVASGKCETRLLYRDPDLLAAALDTLRGAL